MFVVDSVLNFRVSPTVVVVIFRIRCDLMLCYVTMNVRRITDKVQLFRCVNTHISRCEESVAKRTFILTDNLQIAP